MSKRADSPTWRVRHFFVPIYVEKRNIRQLEVVLQVVGRLIAKYSP